MADTNGRVGKMKSRPKRQKEVRLIRQHGLVYQRQPLSLLINHGDPRSSILVGTIFSQLGAPTAKELAAPTVRGMSPRSGMLQDEQMTHLNGHSILREQYQLTLTLHDQRSDAGMPSKTTSKTWKPGLNRPCWSGSHGQPAGGVSSSASAAAEPQVHWQPRNLERRDITSAAGDSSEGGATLVPSWCPLVRCQIWMSKP